MPDSKIQNAREALKAARQCFGPETRRLLEHATHNAAGDRRGFLEELARYGGGAAVRLDPGVFLLVAIVELADVVEENRSLLGR